MSQISKGTSYTAGSPGNQVTYTNLNTLVDGAILLPGAITDQTDIGGATASGDYLMIWDASAGGGAGALRKVVLSGLLYAGQVSFANLESDFIADATAKTAPVPADLLIIGDSADSNIAKKSTITQAAPAIGEALVATDFIADATAKATPVAADLLLIGDSAAANVCKKSTITQASTAIAGAIAANTAVTYTGTNQSVPAAGDAVTLAHGLSATPRFVRWVMVCTTTDRNHAVGEEVGIEHFTNASSRNSFSARANDTNLICVRANDASIYVQNTSNGQHDTITTSSWRLKAYAEK